MHRLVLATHNEHKVRELTDILGPLLPANLPCEVVSAGALGLPEVPEDGVSFAENALIKARAVAAATGLPAIADDSGLCVDILGGAPGIFSARWCGRHGDDQANTALLLAQLSDIPAEHRAAHFECAAALVIGGRETVRTGTMPGQLAFEPRGQGGFGYDPILIADGQGGRTSAELSPAEKNAISHRGAAFRALAVDIVGELAAGSN